jgi:hypothetical protein
MELLDIGFVRPRQARYQAALRPDTMHVEDSTVLFGFPPSDLNSDCARTVQISLALSYCAQLSVAQTIENKEMHFTMRTVGEERCCLPKKQVRSSC